MLTTTLNQKKLIVVGNFFSCNGEIGNPLRVAYTGADVAPWLKEAFDNNVSEEDYGALAQHPDPHVRCLVARNLECLDILANDVDASVRQIAKEALRYTRGPMRDPIDIKREFHHEWVRQ